MLNEEYFILLIIEKLPGIFTARINMVDIHVCVQIWSFVACITQLRA